MYRKLVIVTFMQYFWKFKMQITFSKNNNVFRKYFFGTVIFLEGIPLIYFMDSARCSIKKGRVRQDAAK